VSEQTAHKPESESQDEAADYEAEAWRRESLLRLFRAHGEAWVRANWQRLEDEWAYIKQTFF
jgi:hypothetical protein